jgi:CRISPR-associated protein Csc3
MEITLLQKLLIETLPKSEKDSVLGEFMQTVLPALEREFAFVPALGGSDRKYAKRADQSLLVHVLNGLITAWNLSQELDEPLSQEEARLLCLGFTLHDYDKYNYYCHIQDPPTLQETDEIVALCHRLAQKLNFAAFWQNWEAYLLDICFLAQNTQGKWGNNLNSQQWENGRTFKIEFPERLRLCELLRFGDIAVHLQEPAEIELSTPTGQSLQACLDQLEIEKKLVYHRLRDCRGLVTNHIHNAVAQFVTENNWKPILYFANGVVYLTAESHEIPSLNAIQDTAWQRIFKGNPRRKEDGLEQYFSRGDVGFIRSGKGLKIAPLTRELFSPADLIRQLPIVVKAKVQNFKSPATPKRLEKLSLSQAEKDRLNLYADIWSDRLAEFLILTQREFFDTPEKQKQYINWILTRLELVNEFSPEKTQIQKGGVIYGWYHVAVSFLARQKYDHSPESLVITDFLVDLSQQLANWATENNLLPQSESLTRTAFNDYLAQYLELSGWKSVEVCFNEELQNYAESKVNNKPICSLSTGEFIAEDQRDSVVIFKPQQYSNKNALGGGRIKRGISKIWSLEMLLRQAELSAPAGKLEDRQPVFLYIFPAYVYSPQTALAVKTLVKQMKRMSLWDVRKHPHDLQSLPWQEKKPKAGRFDEEYSTTEMPFTALHLMTPPVQKPTVTESWIEPLFKALALPQLLGVKVVATPSQEPLYTSDKEFLETVKLDGVAGFWTLLGLETSLRLQEIKPALDKLLVVYSLHLDNRSSPPDARWSALNSTVREVMTDVLNVFAIAQQGLRSDRYKLTAQKVQDYWHFAEILAQGNFTSQEKMKLTKRLVSEYRSFYQVKVSESSHAILLPLTKVLEVILSVPDDWDDEELILQGAGQLYDTLDRQDRKKVYRPFLIDKSIAFEQRKAEELQAIQTFMTTCVKELFGQMCKRDRALLQENRNRIKSGAEFAYRLLALQEKKDLDSGSTDS